MKLLTKELLERFEEVGFQFNHDNPIIIAKFITPLFAGNFYATGYDTKQESFYGYFIDVEHGEYLECYFTEESIQGKLFSHDFSAKRDLDFKEIHLSGLLESLSCRLKD